MKQIFRISFFAILQTCSLVAVIFAASFLFSHVTRGKTLSEFLRLSSNNIKTFAADSENYAKAKADCTLFRSADTNNKNASNLFYEIPESYFVKVISRESENVFKVSYSSDVGFVEAGKITRVSFMPENPEPQNITLQILPAHDAVMWSFSESGAGVDTIIPSGSEVKWIASVNSTKPIGHESSVWHYVQYVSSSGTIARTGYIHSETATSLPQIPENTEIEELAPIQVLPPDIDDSLNHPKLVGWLKGLVIAVLALPCISFAVYLVYAMRKNRKQLA